jgi:hypothetical protein
MTAIILVGVAIAVFVLIGWLGGTGPVKQNAREHDRSTWRYR